MVQAARSGRQNIAEGGQATGTSKKFELKLVGVARASSIIRLALMLKRNTESASRYTAGATRQS
jgi:hypothetical protein